MDIQHLSYFVLYLNILQSLVYRLERVQLFIWYLGSKSQLYCVMFDIVVGAFPFSILSSVQNCSEDFLIVSFLIIISLRRISGELLFTVYQNLILNSLVNCLIYRYFMYVFIGFAVTHQKYMYVMIFNYTCFQSYIIHS